MYESLFLIKMEKCKIQYLMPFHFGGNALLKHLLFCLFIGCSINFISLHLHLLQKANIIYVKTKMKEKVISFKKINILSVLFILIVFILNIIAYSYLYAIDYCIFTSMHFITLFISIFIGILMHEVIHAIMFLIFIKSGINSIKMGVIWKYCAAYCHCSEFLSVSQYRLVLIMPTLILGFIPIVLAYMFNNFLLLLFGCMLTSSGIGDFLCIWMLRSFGRKTMVKDHPDKVGFYYI